LENLEIWSAFPQSAVSPPVTITSKIKIVTTKSSQKIPKPADALSRDEFELFLQAYTHEIRNRLNSIALEAVDLAEQAGPQADATRLQRQIQECSAFLKEVREMLAPDSPQKNKITLAEIAKKIRDQDSLK
jgi:signal transduction histidine kinase